METTHKEAPNIDLRIPCKRHAAARAREKVRVAARKWGLDSERVEDLVTAVGEACGNAIEHSESLGLSVLLTRTDRGVEVRIRDEGAGFSPLEQLRKLPDPLAERGRGLYLIEKLVDWLGIRSSPGKGTEIHLVKYFPKKAAPDWAPVEPDVWSEYTRTLHAKYGSIS
ncbi:MAG: ATP-binding protein [Armatimonadetes bacterium]|nr:ATP-binding protein [Armatimonadota bacterium]